MRDIEETGTGTKSEAGYAEERREFLKKYGKFAVVVPPAVTLLMASASKKALASGFTQTKR